MIEDDGLLHSEVGIDAELERLLAEDPGLYMDDSCDGRRKRCLRSLAGASGRRTTGWIKQGHDQSRLNVQFLGSRRSSSHGSEEAEMIKLDSGLGQPQETAKVAVGSTHLSASDIGLGGGLHPSTAAIGRYLSCLNI